MKRVLEFKNGNKKYTSKEWDFDALVMVQEKHIKPENDSIGVICGDAVDYLFEGTDVTHDILNAFPVQKMKMCTTLFGWYMEDMNAVAGGKAE